ncbi:MAG: sodium:solute symporter [Chitinophagales bacterium]
MSSAVILAVVFGYFVLLLAIAFYTSRNTGNDDFFIGHKSSKWYLVAYGMIGTSLSGVTFMSVPGKVNTAHFYYLQVVIGYLIGYIVVAMVLLPLYYRLNLTSIYSYLKERFGVTTYKTGASFFLLSRTLGASLRIYLVLYVLQNFMLAEMGVPFTLTAFVILLMILLYTYKGGVKTIVWTDTLQTTFMILALVVTIGLICSELNFSFGGLVSELHKNNYTDVFNYDWKAKGFMLKQILGGAFITITMTGLDQEMMQKNISIRSLGEAQKNMFTFSGILLVVNLLFLVLGGALYVYVAQKGITLSGQTDDTFPLITLHYLSPIAGVIFIVGLISALFPSADGAMTALTSSFCIDILDFKNRTDIGEKEKEKRRIMVHSTVAVIFFLLILVCKAINEKAVIDLVLDIAAYTYGPLLGLFSFGILTKRKLNDALTPVICITAVVLAVFISPPIPDKIYSSLPQFFTDYKTWREGVLHGYQMGLELLVINGLLTFAGLWAISTKVSTTKQ